MGMRSYNGKISIINEPTKWFKDNGGVARLSHFINMAYPIVKHFGFVMGAGNMEFYDSAVLGDWYGYICANAYFDDLDIHLQASCDNEHDLRKYTDYAYWLADTNRKELDCTEAFYGNIQTTDGWNLLNRQLDYAEYIGCKNFGNVFNNLDTSVFPVLEDSKTREKWFQLAFKINGTVQTNRWYDWVNIIDAKAPVPNINIPIEDDDMKLEVLRVGSKGNQVQWLQEILELEYGYENEGGFDGKFGNLTDAQVRLYQESVNITVDGLVGKQTMTKLINDAEVPDDWYRQLVMYMSYE
jgi:hypothetical protein